MTYLVVEKEELTKVIRQAWSMFEGLESEYSANTGAESVKEFNRMIAPLGLVLHVTDQPDLGGLAEVLTIAEAADRERV